MLWGDRAGWACTARGIDPFRDAKGGYKHREWKEVAYRWPEARGDLLRDLVSAASDDAYVAPLLRDARTRRVAESSPLPGRYAWLDADHWDPEREHQLAATGARILQVDSGGGNGSRHIYVDLEALEPGLAVADYAKRLADALGTDTYGGDNKLLRLPGTFNHKPRVAGGRPQLVRWLE